MNFTVKANKVTPLGKTLAGLTNIESLLIDHAQTSTINWERKFEALKSEVANKIGTDPWGNDYQIRDRFISTNDLQNNMPFLYSFGPDGRSETLGNDSDDINSWDNHHLDYHGKRQETARRTKLVIWSFLISPMIFVLIVLLTNKFNRTPK